MTSNPEISQADGFSAELRALIAEYEAYAAASGLTLGSCDEMLVDGHDLNGVVFSAAQTAWLNDFAARWEAADARYWDQRHVTEQGHLRGARDGNGTD